MFAFANAAPLRPTLFCAASRSTCVIPHLRTFAQKHAVVAKASGTPSKRRMPAVLRPVVPTSELFQFDVEDKAQLRSDILRRVNAYVKQHDLQDPSNRRIILCDDKLKKLLGVDTCTHFEINGFISPYIRKPEEIGGRYVDEARLVEQKYLEQKDIEQAENPTKPRRKKAPKKPSKPRTFKPVVLSDDLSIVCRSKEMTRPEVLRSVWAYIKLNQLQKESGQPIQCDFLLNKVFKCKELDPRGVMKGLSPHLSKKE